MTIYIGADHRGFHLKEKITLLLRDEGHDVHDCGDTVYDAEDDFPDFTFSVADKVMTDAGSRGIVICGSGGGVTIAANKVKGIRCATAVHVSDVKHNRESNDINVLSLSADFTDFDEAKELVRAFLHTEFGGEERCVRRLNKIASRDR
jgi:ribose 5-phosphate isomerase B